MTYVDCLEACGGGFDFSNVRRNEVIAANANMSIPTLKTGTTICGIVCKSAVILGADTRATMGSIVFEKNAEKLHRIADNIYCAGAGVSADLLHTTLWMETVAELHRLNTNRVPRVSMVVSTLSQELFKYMGYKHCALVIGGMDIQGPSLYKVDPRGSSDKNLFCSMGSGSLNALAVLENGYKDNLSIEEGKDLVCRAILAGILNDLGSGSNVDICVISDKTTLFRGYNCVNSRIFRQPKPVTFDIGTTTVLRQKVESIKHLIAVEDEDVEMSG